MFTEGGSHRLAHLPAASRLLANRSLKLSPHLVRLPVLRNALRTPRPVALVAEGRAEVVVRVFSSTSVIHL